MKIKVADLEPNPFREIGNYPIDKRKVNSLKLSISETTFWDNVLARPHPTKKNKYQIAYGHHRLQALRELGIIEVDIPVRELTDAQMIRIMAEENLEWLTSPKVIHQTVISVKKYLDGEFAKTDTMSDLPPVLMNLLEQKTEKSYNKTKAGVGQTTILKFLGGNWKQHLIQSALTAYHLAEEGKLDLKAVEVFDKIDHADKFRAAVKELEVPKKEQLAIAKKVKKNLAEKKTTSQGRTRNGKTKRSIADDVSDLVMPMPSLAKKKKRKKKALPNIVEFVFKCENDTDSLTHKLKELCPEITEIANKGRLLGRLIPALKRLEGTIVEVVEEYERTRSEKENGKKVVASVQVLD